jgi:PAS domain-containing protein
VRSRDLSAEGPVWYVYRDGAWRPNSDAPWWLDARLGRMGLDGDGWIVEANPTARGLLGIDVGAPLDHHFSDFAAPGTLADISSLFGLLTAGNVLEATLRMRPLTGDVIAMDVRVGMEGETARAVLRLADDVEVEPGDRLPPPPIDISPVSDVVFAAYVGRVLARMPEPTPDGLELRLRRLYPHAAVQVSDGRWAASRERRGTPAEDGWWADEALPTVRYDADGLILEANGQARDLLGQDVVGRHWQDIVTPGSTNQVGPVIELIRTTGSAVSRFRMPAHDGRLVEFDSWTTVAGDTLTTVMRPV